MNPLLHPWKVASGNQVILDVEPEKVIVRPVASPDRGPQEFTKPRQVVFFYNERSVAEHIVKLHNEWLKEMHLEVFDQP